MGSMGEVKPDYDAIVVGAGFGGLRIIHNLRKLGLSYKVVEAGTSVGGTWYWYVAASINLHHPANPSQEQVSRSANRQRELGLHSQFLERTQR